MAAAPSMPAWADDVQVTPNWEGAPWVGKVQLLLNVTAQAALACCVLALLVGGASLAVGRILGANQAGSRGLQLILGGVGGALVIISAASIVAWLTK
jgi:hypothetical protein